MKPATKAIIVRGARINNLKSVNLEIKPECFHVLTGPSGSGKSSLAFDVLYAEADRLGFAYGLHKVFRKENPIYKVENLPTKVIGIEQQILHQTIIESVGWHTGFLNLILQNDKKICPRCKGQGYIQDVDVDRLVKKHDKPVTRGAFSPPVKALAHLDTKNWTDYCKKLGVKYATPWRQLPDEIKNFVLTGGLYNFKGFATALREFKNGEGKVPRKLAQQLQEELDFYIVNTACPKCGAYGFLDVDRKLIRPNETLGSIMEKRLIKLENYELKIFNDLGLSKLPILHPIFKLSMTEARNLRFFSNLIGLDEAALVIFDEPAAGLLPQEAKKMASIFKEISSLGHTVLGIEHSPEFVQEADTVTAFGPGSGVEGGKIVFQGIPEDYVKSKHNPTSMKLQASNKRVIPQKNNCVTNRYIQSHNFCSNKRSTAKSQHLQAIFHVWYGFTDFSFEIPLGKMVCVCGPIGSGKTAFVQAVFASCDKTSTGWQGRVDLADREGSDRLRRPYLITPEAIGKHAGSTPATYIGLWDRIRELYSEQPDAKKHRMNKSYFSFNTKDGRCPNCLGHGFLTSNHVRFTECPVCGGSRMNPKVKTVKYKGHHIAAVNGLTISESMALFTSCESIRHYLEFLSATALEYLVLGQPSNSLSGGEAQRVRIAAQLCRRLGDRSLYILDNPFRGIGTMAIPKLYKSLRGLVKKNNSVLIAENIKEVVCNCDWVIALGQPLEKAGKKQLNVIYEGVGQKCPAKLWRR